jgi:nitroimidazol reductase NimA-like FMN-containing flavoprotein (pyridoxamine 5'-phosphate oxidase superfamily)
MSFPRMLDPDECLELISRGGVGRVALSTPTGPEIFPVNFVVDARAIVFRTSPYSVLGTYSWGGEIAFEADEIFPDERQGWSVVAHGRGGIISGLADLERLRSMRQPEPWAAGTRPLYIRLTWSRISGRALGDPHRRDSG